MIDIHIELRQQSRLNVTNGLLRLDIVCGQEMDLLYFPTWTRDDTGRHDTLQGKE